ncbi:hypothetical protein ADK67_46550 [Saccharothrix sp. NRRL B-16348]|nr:hypothetical protein ADK67_46550 [Saccharothrix sp. NRRL B-16348]
MVRTTGSVVGGVVLAARDPFVPEGEPVRQRLTVLLASLGLALGGLAVTAGPASAASYGYINWTNNCSGPKLYSIIYASGTKSGTLVVQQSNVAAGAKRSQRVQSGYKYNVTANGGWDTVTIYNISGRVHSVAVKAC